MIDGIRFKVCGLTSLVDVEFADRCGADYFGFIFHPKSPRCIPLAQYRAMATRLPERRKVAVSVEPSLDELKALQDAGFDYFQIHYRIELPDTRLTEWSRLVGEKHLWLAPKLPPGTDVPAAALATAKFIKRHQTAHSKNFWILAGGLNPENVGDALRETGARFVDVNSGVESAPGVKDEGKLKRFVVALHEAATRGSKP